MRLTFLFDFVYTWTNEKNTKEKPEVLFQTLVGSGTLRVVFNF
jgi:hypothetical protein